ncbi:MAG: DUF6261 family protein [Tannerella sp.]|nr:DUF6261 family protein [Tannerella sp.]
MILETNKDTCEAFVRERNTETASRPQIRLAEKRPQVQQVYAQITECIETLAFINGETAFAPIRQRMERFRAAIQSHTLSAQRAVHSMHKIMPRAVFRYILLKDGSGILSEREILQVM